MSQPTPVQYHAGLKAVIKRAIIVMDAMGDSEMRFFAAGGVWDRVTGDALMAYGYNHSTFRIVPTSREISQAEIVAGWLAWLGLHEGPKTMPRLVAWAHDDPIWRIAEREGCSIRTIHNRIDRSIAAILHKFGNLEMDIPEVDEPMKVDAPPNFFTERPMVADAGEREVSRKCWIDGVGFMKDGKRLNTGHDKIKDRMLNGR